MKGAGRPASARSVVRPLVAGAVSFGASIDVPDVRNDKVKLKR